MFPFTPYFRWTLLFLAAIALFLFVGNSEAKTCSWDHPGVNPNTASFEDSIHRIAKASGMPPAVEEEFIAKVNNRHYEDKVVVTKYTVKGEHHAYSTDIKNMLWGDGKLCQGLVTRTWDDQHFETGWVFHVDGWNQDLFLPETCRNFALLTRVVAPVGAGFLAPVDPVGGGYIVPFGGIPGVVPPIFVPPPSVPEVIGAPTELAKETILVPVYLPSEPYPFPEWHSGPVVTITKVVSAVPEASTFIMLLLGITVIAAHSLWNKRERKNLPRIRR